MAVFYQKFAKMLSDLEMAVQLKAAETQTLSFSLRVIRIDRTRSEDIRGTGMMDVLEIKSERPD